MKIAAYSRAPAGGLRRPTGHGADAGRHAGPPARALPSTSAATGARQLSVEDGEEGGSQRSQPILRSTGPGLRAGLPAMPGTAAASRRRL